MPLNGIVVTPSQKTWGYRNKAHLHIIWDGRTPRFAYHEPETLHSFVEIKGCSLLSDLTNSLLSEFLAIIETEKLTFIEEIVIKESFSANEMLMVLYVSSQKQLESLIGITEGLKSKFPLTGAVCLTRRDRSTDEIIITGENTLREKIAGKTFHIGPESFFQINVGVLEALVKAMREYFCLTGKEVIADVYCGVGTFGIALAQNAKEVIGIEASPKIPNS